MCDTSLDAMAAVEVKPTALDFDAADRYQVRQDAYGRAWCFGFVLDEQEIEWASVCTSRFALTNGPDVMVLNNTDMCKCAVIPEYIIGRGFSGCAGLVPQYYFPQEDQDRLLEDDKFKKRVNMFDDGGIRVRAKVWGRNVHPSSRFFQFPEPYALVRETICTQNVSVSHNHVGAFLDRTSR